MLDDKWFILLWRSSHDDNEEWFQSYVHSDVRKFSWWDERYSWRSLLLSFFENTIQMIMMEEDHLDKNNSSDIVRTWTQNVISWLYLCDHKRSFGNVFYRSVVWVESADNSSYILRMQKRLKRRGSINEHPLFEGTQQLEKLFIVDTCEESTTQSRFAIYFIFLVNLVGSERHFRCSHSFIVAPDNDRSSRCSRIEQVRIRYEIWIHVNMCFVLEVVCCVPCNDPLLFCFNYDVYLDRSWNFNGNRKFRFKHTTVQKHHHRKYEKKVYDINVRDASCNHEAEGTKIMKVSRY